MFLFLSDKTLLYQLRQMKKVKQLYVFKMQHKCKLSKQYRLWCDNIAEHSTMLGLDYTLIIHSIGQLETILVMIFMAQDNSNVVYFRDRCVCVCVCMCMYVCVCVCVCVCMCVCVCVCVYLYLYLPQYIHVIMCSQQPCKSTNILHLISSLHLVDVTYNMHTINQPEVSTFA